MNADGSNVRRLTHLEKDEGRLCCPDWSPDGEQVAFMVLEPPMHPVLHVLALDTGGISRLGSGGPPRWSPDGKWIAFFSGSDKQVHVRSTDGSESHKITNVEGFATYPSWSPNGDWIVFNHVPAPGDFDSTELFVVRADGSDQRQVTDNAVMDGHASWW
jgi:TolB protein